MKETANKRAKSWGLPVSISPNYFIRLCTLFILILYIKFTSVSYIL